MKKREITNNNLEQMFTNIIEREPLLTENQVNSFLNSLPGPNSGSSVKRFFQNYLNAFLLSATVVLIIVTALILINFEHQSEETIVQSIQEENPVAPDTITAETVVVIDKEISQNTEDVDSVIKESTLKSSTVIVQADTIISFSDVYKHFDKQPQVFSIQAIRDTTIVCKEGTTIKINANTFIAEKTGNEMTGNVRIAVKEYYKMSDIILSNLTTTSGGKILETGGMLHISASADKENCIIKPGSNIEIGFPYLNKKEDMALFYGEQTNNLIDWKLANKTDDMHVADVLKIGNSEESTTQVFFIVEDMPEFPGGELALRRYISDNLKYPVDAAESGIGGKVYVTFIINKEGSITNVNIARPVHPSLDREALRVVNSLPKWKPGKQRGRPVSVSYTIPVNFTLGVSTLTKEEFEKKVKDDNFKETTVSEVYRYLFNVTQMGWINCDKFYRKNVSIINYSILTEEPEKTNINLIFHSFKAILPGYIESNRIIFNRVPLGEKVTIVALKTVDNKILLAIKETVISNKEITDLNFQLVTLDLLKMEMEKLNKYY